MKITSDLFHAYLKCPTKCWLRATNALATENDYPKWVKTQNSSYRAAGVQRLVAASPTNEIALSPDLKDVNTALWRLATNLVMDARLDSNILESDLHAVQLVPAKGHGQSAYLIPIRFIFTNKLDKDDKLLLAFDALTLSRSLGCEIGFGKIIHGDDHAISKVKISKVVGEVRKRIAKVAAVLTNCAPPELILNRHCAECEFQSRCHKEATQQDDLSLLSGMTAKKLNSRGTFTVKQLSFAFLPRRRFKKMRDKQERYHHSLKALAIRENKLHIVGRPELRIEGTPVFFDVEGIPDREFYYLIGLRLRNGDSIVQHSLWADTAEDEAQIYFQFLNILKNIDKPSLIHYGSFETEFLRQMGVRYGTSIQAVLENNGNHTPTNFLSIINGQVYFPTYSNSLKSIAPWLGFQWSGTSLTSVKSIVYRHDWEASHDIAFKIALVDYNAEDCQAAEIVAHALLQLHSTDHPMDHSEQRSGNTIYVESLRNPHKTWGPFESEFKEFEKINGAAWWNYQRDRIWVRSKKLADPKAPQLRRAHLGPHNHLPVGRTIIYPKLSSCPSCRGELTERPVCKRILYDLWFGKSSVKRWIVRCQFHYYWCSHCYRKFGEPKEFWPGSHLGRTLVAYVLYHSVELCIPFKTIGEILTRCFKLDISSPTLATAKKTAARQYKSTYEAILRHLVNGNLLHVDETQVSIRDASAYIWVFTNLHDVIYLYRESREGAFLQEMLKDFRGILVSDFFAGYDSLNCDQQKCLIHLMRELNDNVLKHPYDEELKNIVREFAVLLKAIVDTIDRRGLKKRFLRKHQLDVERFYREIGKVECKSEEATRCKNRFVRTRAKLFTFLNHDGAPWHNNNAEHAIKAFAKLRDITRGSFTERSVKNDMILLSICQTCKYSDLDFFEFLRSGETNIYAFAESARGRRRTRQQQQASLSQ